LRPTPSTPPGAFVSGEHRDDCARFLADARELAARREAAKLDIPANRRNTVKT
jgi:hypothetical protein